MILKSPLSACVTKPFATQPSIALSICRAEKEDSLFLQVSSIIWLFVSGESEFKRDNKSFSVLVKEYTVFSLRKSFVNGKRNKKFYKNWNFNGEYGRF